MEHEQNPRQRSFISELVPEWRPTRAQVLWTIRIVLVFVVLTGVLALVGLPFGITLWEWLKLLIVPVVIAAGGLWFNRQLRDREMQIAEQRAQDEALQAYLDQIGNLLLGKDTQGRQPIERDEVRTLLRAWTLAVLPRLDGLRKRTVVQFLYESRLITKDNVVLDLSEAFLNYADLIDVNLKGAHLREVRLVKANLYASELSETDLSGAILFGADLRWANLHEADVSKAVLMSDDTGSIPFPRTPSATMSNTFGGTEPKNADLSGVDLSGADLTDAYVSEKQLISAWSLEGATMPNGQKYEDWLKSKDSGEE